MRMIRQKLLLRPQNTTKGSVLVAKVGPELTVTALQVSIDAPSVTPTTELRLR
jgi:hypothetical protein